MKWINVKDILPELEKNVLVFNKDGVNDQISIGCYWGTRDIHEKKYPGSFYTAWSIYGPWECDSPFEIPTHWMPLPEPPEN